MKILKWKKKHSGTPSINADSPSFSESREDIHSSRNSVNSKASSSKHSKSSLKKSKKDDDKYGSSRSLRFSFGKKKSKKERIPSESYSSEISRHSSEDETMFGDLFSNFEETDDEHDQKPKTTKYSEKSRLKPSPILKHRKSPSISDNSRSGIGAPANSEVPSSPHNDNSYKYKLNHEELMDKLSNSLDPSGAHCGIRRCRTRARSHSPPKNNEVLPCGHSNLRKNLNGINLNANPIIINRIIADGNVTKGFLTKLDAKEAEIEELILENMQLKNKKSEKNSTVKQSVNQEKHLRFSKQRIKELEGQLGDVQKFNFEEKIITLEHQLSRLCKAYDGLKELSAAQTDEILNLNKALESEIAKNMILCDENNSVLQYNSIREYERDKLLMKIKKLHDENLRLRNENSKLKEEVEASDALKKVLKANISDMRNQARDISNMVKSQSYDHNNKCIGNCREKLHSLEEKYSELENKEFSKNSEILFQQNRLSEITAMKSKLEEQLSESDRHIKSLLAEVEKQLQLKSPSQQSLIPKSNSLRDFEKNYSVLLDTVNSKIEKIKVDVVSMNTLIQSIKQKLQDIIKDNEVKSTKVKSELKTIISNIEDFEKSHKPRAKSPRFSLFKSDKRLL